MTRARLLRTGIPAPFERDLGTAVERRGRHAADVAPRGRKQPTEPVRPDADEADPDDVGVIDPEDPAAG